MQHAFTTQRCTFGGGCLQTGWPWRHSHANLENRTPMAVSRTESVPTITCKQQTEQHVGQVWSAALARYDQCLLTAKQGGPATPWQRRRHAETITLSLLCQRWLLASPGQATEPTALLHAAALFSPLPASHWVPTPSSPIATVPARRCRPLKMAAPAAGAEWGVNPYGPTGSPTGDGVGAWADGSSAA